MPKSQEYAVISERDEEGYFVAEVLELRSCYTQAKSLDELMRRIREVIQLCAKEQKPNPRRLRFVGVQRVSV